jgi:hypothetical protein
MRAKVQVVLLTGQIFPALVLPVQLRLFPAPSTLGSQRITFPFLFHDFSFMHMAPAFLCCVVLSYLPGFTAKLTGFSR